MDQDAKLERLYMELFEAEKAKGRAEEEIRRLRRSINEHVTRLKAGIPTEMNKMESILYKIYQERQPVSTKDIADLLFCSLKKARGRKDWAMREGYLKMHRRGRYILTEKGEELIRSKLGLSS